MRIAIVALNAYPAIVPHAGTAVGGLETFAWSLARTLARDPAKHVQIVVRHTSPAPQRVIDGVELLCDVERFREIRREVSQSVEFTARAPWMRVRRFRPGLLWQVPLLAVVKLVGPRLPLPVRIDALLRSGRPDVILVLGIGEGSAAAVQSGLNLGIPSWFWVRSNNDLDERFLTDENSVNPYGTTSAEARATFQADGILCQTHEQQDRVMQLLRRESVVIPNPVDGERFPIGEPSSAARTEILWVGRYDSHHKRPQLALDLARRCPGIPFHFIINRGDPDIERWIRSSCPPNVRLTDYIARDAMPGAYRAARLFLSTGSNAYEGFPNVLLEAASSGTPIVSLEEFDHFLERSHAGVSAYGDVERLATQVRKLWEMPPEWPAHSQSGAEYVRREHALDRCVQRFIEALRSP